MDNGVLTRTKLRSFVVSRTCERRSKLPEEHNVVRLTNQNLYTSTHRYRRKRCCGCHEGKKHMNEMHDEMPQFTQLVDTTYMYHEKKAIFLELFLDLNCRRMFKIQGRIISR